MKKVSFLALIASVLLAQSCSKCIKCESTYVGETTPHVDEWCDGETLNELNTLYEGKESAKQIESGWSCK